LRLRDLTRANLFSLPWELQPTLLLDHIPDSRSARSLIFCSNNRGSYVESKGNLIDVCCSKAVYLGTVLAESDPDYLSLRVSLVPFRGRLPVLAQSTQRQIADEIQSKMLAYRVQNYADVTQSKFDLPQYCSETRMLAHALGACVVDAPEVQAGIESLLHDGEESARSARWCDPRCVTLESFLVHCHAEQAERIPIGMIARYANGILRGRGETTALGPKEAGGILRSLGVVPKRNSKGYAIKLTAGVRRRAHELARDFDVAAVQERLSQCPLCVELFPSGDGDLLDQASPSQGEARGADSA